MTKLKSHSGAKKRFKITGTGKIVGYAWGKRHGMTKRSRKFVRNARGPRVLASGAQKMIAKLILPQRLRKPRYISKALRLQLANEFKEMEFAAEAESSSDAGGSSRVDVA